MPIWYLFYQRKVYVPPFLKIKNKKMNMVLEESWTARKINQSIVHEVTEDSNYEPKFWIHNVKVGDSDEKNDEKSKVILKKILKEEKIPWYSVRVQQICFI